MYIAVFSQSMHENMPEYRGLYRLGPFPARWLETMHTTDPLYSLWEWYADQGENGTIYSAENMQKAKHMCRQASERGFNQDLILYGEVELINSDSVQQENAVLLGYDVCGDAMYYSYLGDAVFREDLYPDLTPCWKITHAYFAPRLNEHLLFGSLKDAQMFAELQEEMTRIGYGEGESNWRPVAIYSVPY